MANLSQDDTNRSLLGMAIRQEMGLQCRRQRLTLRAVNLRSAGPETENLVHDRLQAFEFGERSQRVSTYTQAEHCAWWSPEDSNCVPCTRIPQTVSAFPPASARRLVLTQDIRKLFSWAPVDSHLEVEVAVATVSPTARVAASRQAHRPHSPPKTQAAHPRSSNAAPGVDIVSFD
jgi:hypothetical protein